MSLKNDLKNKISHMNRGAILLMQAMRFFFIQTDPIEQDFNRRSYLSQTKCHVNNHPMFSCKISRKFGLAKLGKKSTSNQKNDKISIKTFSQLIKLR